jgi:MFS family permease
VTQGNEEPAAGSGSDSQALPATTPVSVHDRGVTPTWAWGAFGVLFLGFLLDTVDRWLLPAVLRPLSRELELSEEEASRLATVLLVSYALWCPIVGYLADRLRRPRLLAVGVAVWSLATVGTGLAQSFDQLQLARVLVGIGGATFEVTALTILMDLFPRGVRARVLAAYFLAIPVGALVGLILGSALAEIATWHTAFLVAGAPGLVLSLITLALPDPVRGTSEGVDEDRLRLHERVGPSRDDYVDLMVNSSYTYSVFGLAFSMFAIGGLAFWLPTFLMVVHGVPSERVSSRLSLTIAGAMAAGTVLGGWFVDRLSRSNPRALFLVPGLAMLGSIPILLLAIFGRNQTLIFLGVFAAISFMFTNIGPCYAIIANVVMPNMRGVACAVALAAVHLLGDLWSPSLMGWMADTFGEVDSMATPFGQALEMIGALPAAQPGRDPQNLTAALLTAVPALLIAGTVLLAGARHLPREMILMLAKLRALPTHGMVRSAVPPAQKQQPT